MDFAYSEDQQALLDLAERILADRATPERLKRIERGGGVRYDDALWAELAKAGLVGIGIPESEGGSGFGFLEAAGVLEKIGATTAPVPYLETVVGGAFPIVAFGSASQRASMLPRIAAGDLVLAVGLREAEVDLTTPSMQLLEGKGETRLNGSKFAVAYASVAERILVSATDSSGRIVLYFVDPGAPGVTLTPLRTTSGMPESKVDFDEVAVDDADRLGTPENGAEILSWVLERLHAAQASFALGVCSEALRLTAEYTKNRKQFGQPIASFQAAGHRAADAYIDTEAIRLTARQAAWRIAAGVPAGPQVAVAKFYAADAGHRVVHAAQHLHGGVGVDRDYPLHRYFLYARHIELSLGHGSDQLRSLGAMIADGRCR